MDTDRDMGMDGNGNGDTDKSPRKTSREGDHADSGPSSSTSSRRPSRLRFVTTIAVACAAVLALYLWQPGWFSGPGFTKPSGVVKVAPTPTPKPPKPQSYPYLGDTVGIAGVQFTPLRVQYTPGSGADQANAGDTYAIVTLRVENHQSRDYNLVPGVPCQLGSCNFYVQDSEGRKNTPVLFDPYHMHMRPVVLRPGSFMVGDYAFEVPQLDAKRQTLQLLYYHDPLLDPNTVVHWYLRARHGG